MATGPSSHHIHQPWFSRGKKTSYLAHLKIKVYRRIYSLYIFYTCTSIHCIYSTGTSIHCIYSTDTSIHCINSTCTSIHCTYSTCTSIHFIVYTRTYFVNIEHLHASTYIITQLQIDNLREPPLVSEFYQSIGRYCTMFMSTRFTLKNMMINSVAQIG